jgi:hypothetical protein
MQVSVPGIGKPFMPPMVQVFRGADRSACFVGSSAALAPPSAIMAMAAASKGLLMRVLSLWFRPAS